MTINYRDIPGWGDFITVHTEALKDAPDGACVVELGVAFGRGIATLVEAADRLKKKIRIVGIDNFAGESPEDYEKYYKGFSLESTVEQLKRFGVEPHQYEIIVGDTAKSAALLENEKRLYYVFLDADHSYNGVLLDIQAWWSKIAQGGHIGGHDFEFPTVSSAVKSVFPNPRVIESNNWLVRKE